MIILVCEMFMVKWGRRRVNERSKGNRKRWMMESKKKARGRTRGHWEWEEDTHSFSSLRILAVGLTFPYINGPASSHFPSLFLSLFSVFLLFICFFFYFGSESSDSDVWWGNLYFLASSVFTLITFFLPQLSFLFPYLATSFISISFSFGYCIAGIGIPDLLQLASILFSIILI